MQLLSTYQFLQWCRLLNSAKLVLQMAQLKTFASGNQIGAIRPVSDLILAA
jgi:hypothetical protein